MAKEQTSSIDGIINELKIDLNKETVIGPFSVKELTYEQQRRLLNNQTSFAEAAATIGSILNDFIAENVQFTDDIVDVRKNVTVIQKAYILNSLRKISYGDTFTSDGVNYKLYEVKDTDFELAVEPRTIEHNGLKINLAVPTIATDTHFNRILSQALSSYKNRQSRSISEVESADLLFKYNLYEQMKYIESFEFNGKVYTFNDLIPRSCLDFMNILKASIIRKITEFQEEVQEKILPALTIYNEETAETKEVSNIAEFFVQDLDEAMSGITL